MQVVSVAASRHSLVVTADGVLYSMGPNNSAGGGGYGSQPLLASGQLGRQGGTAPGVVLLPGPALPAAASAPAAGAAGSGAGGQQQPGNALVQVASGRYHSVAVTADGSVMTWGLNDWGQLGRQVPDSPAASADGVDLQATSEHSVLAQHQQAAAGSSSSSLTAAAAGAAPTPTSSSNLTASGSHGWRCHSGTPGLVTALAGVKAVAAAAGRYSTLVLDDAGHLWVWGYDGCAGGQLPAQGGAWQPRSVAGALASKKVVAFDVGESS